MFLWEVQVYSIREESQLIQEKDIVLLIIIDMIVERYANGNIIMYELV